MSLIKRCLQYEGSEGVKPLDTTFDPSLNLSCISPEVIKGIAQTTRLGRIRLIKNTEVKEVVLLDFYINNVLLSDEFFVVPELTEKVIIGAATIRKWRIRLNFEEDLVEVDPKAAKMQLMNSSSLKSLYGTFVPDQSADELIEDIKKARTFNNKRIEDWTINTKPGN